MYSSAVFQILCNKCFINVVVAWTTSCICFTFLMSCNGCLVCICRWHMLEYNKVTYSSFTSYVIINQHDMLKNKLKHIAHNTIIYNSMRNILLDICLYVRFLWYMSRKLVTQNKLKFKYKWWNIKRHYTSIQEIMICEWRRRNHFPRNE